MPKKKIAKKPKKKIVTKKKVTKKAVKKTVKKTAKKTAVKPKKKLLAIPKGYSSVTPYLIVNQAGDAIEFYKKAFAAKEMMRFEQPDGRIGHAELKIGDAIIMIADECPEVGARSPEAFGGSAISIHLYMKNVDMVVDKAVSAGAKLVKPIENMFYGDRSGTLEDPYGHKWHVATHIEDVSPAQMKKRVAAMFDQSSESSQ